MSHHIYQCPHYWDAPERHWVCTACISGVSGLKDAMEALVTAMDLTKKNEALTAERDRLRAALALAARWLGDHHDPLGTFEDIADWFYRETGYLRPGKSEPLECGDRNEEREAAWKAWTGRTRDLVISTCKAALAESEGA